MDNLQIVVQGAIAQRYVAAVGFIVCVYDHVITLDDEIRLIWMVPTSLAKIFFLINRYVVPTALVIDAYMMAGFASPKSNSFCAWYTFIGFVAQSLEGGGLIPAMLLLRVYALYNCDRRVLIALSILLCSVTVSCLTISGLALKEFRNGAIMFLSQVNMCVPEGRGSSWWVIWLMLMIYESSIFLLIVFKTWKYARTHVRTPFLSILLRDGIAFYATMLGVEIFTLLTWVALPVTSFTIGLDILWGLQAMLVSRIYLNLKKVSNHEDSSEATAVRLEQAWIERWDRPTMSVHQWAASHSTPEEESHELEDRESDTLGLF